jgi:hypothetical protein
MGGITLATVIAGTSEGETPLERESCSCSWIRHGSKDPSAERSSPDEVAVLPGFYHRSSLVMLVTRLGAGVDQAAISALLSSVMAAVSEFGAGTPWVLTSLVMAAQRGPKRCSV